MASGPRVPGAFSAISVKYFDMNNLIEWLTDYKYAVLFPLAILEGPVVAVVAGWLCAAGLMRLSIAYPIVVAGDMISDTGCYLLGRLTSTERLGRLAQMVGVNPAKIRRLRCWLRNNPVKMISISKIALGVGPAGIFLAGQSGVPYSRFLSICIGMSALQYFFYLLAGMLLGHGYLALTHYLTLTASFFIAVSLGSLAFFIIRSHFRKL